MLQMLQMMQGFGDAGKVGAVRRGCHATDAGPTTTRSVRASIHGTSTAEHRMPFDVSTASPAEACASENIPSTFIKSQVQL
jgi:hypothetical protein